MEQQVTLKPEVLRFAENQERKKSRYIDSDAPCINCTEIDDVKWSRE